MNLLDKLKPRFSAQELSIKAYSSDAETFSKFVEFLNNKQEAGHGQYLEEDIFAQLVEPLKEVSEFQSYLRNSDSKAQKKRGRKKKESSKSINTDSQGSGVADNLN